MTLNRQRGTGGRVPGLLVALPIVAALWGCDLDLGSVLEVDVPGRVAAEALENAALAGTLADGVIGDTECAWNNYAAASSHHSDEWIPTSGNLNMRNWGQRKIEAGDAVMAQGSCAANYGIYTPLHTARFQAEDIFNRLEGFSIEDVPDKVDLQGVVKAYGAYATLALGEGFCSMAINGGPRLTPAAVLGVAEALFGDAIGIAQGTGNSDILNMARVGRARARLFLGDFTGAITDAGGVPDGYVKMASRGSSEVRRWNANLEYLNNPDSEVSKHGSVASTFHNLTVDAAGNPTQDDGTPDPRVVVSTRGELGFDFTTVHYFHDKYTARESPVPMASYKEAQLIIAEASARTGDLNRARGIINDRHALAGLPMWDVAGTATQDQVFEHVLEERRRELFQEAGHRLNDMLRFRGTAQEIPFLGEPGSIHPNGLDQSGLEYGTITCFPLPLIEENGNENLGG